MQKHELARPVSVDVLIIKLDVELLRDRLRRSDVLLLKHVLERGGGVLELGIRLPFLPQALRRQDFRLRERLLPRCDVKMVLEIRCSNVLDIPTQRVHLFAHFGGKADGREHGEGARGELD